MDPGANRDNGSPLRGDGNLFVPFSIYSSSVTDGYNDAVVDNYAPNIQITNLHHDLVYNTDTLRRVLLPKSLLAAASIAISPSMREKTRPLIAPKHLR